MRDLIESATALPSMPKLLQELIVSFQNDSISSGKLASMISSDQALTAKVLRLANSVRYGGHRKVGSVQDAVVVLGTDALRTLVLSLYLTNHIKTTPTFNMKAYWTHSFKIANRTRWLAKLVKADPEIAYTCGLLHGLGEYLIHIIKPELAQLIDTEVAAGNRRRETELKYLGFDFTKAGAELARYWHFPEEIALAIEQQYTPATGNKINPYAALIMLARYMVDNQKSIQAEQFDQFPVRLTHAMHIKLEDAHRHMLAMPDVDEDLSLYLS